MAGKEISAKKYVVRLSAEERQRLETLIRKGRGPARRLLKARILLKADVSERGPGWSDGRIIAASSIMRATRQSAARSEKPSQTSSPAVLGHPTEG